VGGANRRGRGRPISWSWCPLSKVDQEPNAHLRSRRRGRNFKEASLARVSQLRGPHRLRVGGATRRHSVGRKLTAQEATGPVDRRPRKRHSWQ
jgi:hypothetical protein